MKKSIALITLTSTMLLVGCKNESAEREKIAQENIDSYSKTWELVINEGKVDVLDTAYAPEIVLHTVPEIKGIAKSKAYYAYFVTGFSNRKFIVKEIFASGDKLTKYWQFKGTHTGDFMGIPATGKTIDVEGCTIARMVNGKIVEERDFMDNMDFMKQLGLLK
jgi:predicted ester cyclase